MGDEVTMQLTPSGIKGGFIQVSSTNKGFFPSGFFILVYNDQRFNVRVNYAYRIVCKNLFSIIHPRRGDKITIRKEPDDVYSIHLKDVNTITQ